MTNNPSNHLPSFNEWFNSMIDDMDQAALNLFNRAHNEFLPKVAHAASLDLDEDTVHWADIVNGVAKTIARQKPGLAKSLIWDLSQAVMFPEEFMAERAALWTLEDEMAAIWKDMDAEDNLR